MGVPCQLTKLLITQFQCVPSRVQRRTFYPGLRRRFLDVKIWSHGVHLFFRSAYEQQINSSLIWSLSHMSTQKNATDLIISFIHFLQVVRTRTQFNLSIPPLATGLLLVSILTCLTQCVVYCWIVLWHRRSWEQAAGLWKRCAGVNTSRVFTDFIFTCTAPSKSGKL